MKEHKIFDYINFIRPKNWVKNFLVFVPCLFNGSFFNSTNMQALVIAFLIFCFVSSSIYVLNDIRDVNVDRLHPIKKNRPLASGRISLIEAYTIGFIMLFFSITMFFFVSHSKLLSSATIVLAYVILNISYSCGAKDIPIVDVFILASGFVLRTFLGSTIIGIQNSQWLILTVMMFSLYMGLGKRRNELQYSNKSLLPRKVLKYYTNSYLNGLMILTMTLGLVFYSLWAAFVMSSIPNIIWTIPLVIYILMKYELDIETKEYGDPVEIVTKDKTIILAVFVYVIVIVMSLYFK